MQSVTEAVVVAVALVEAGAETVAEQGRGRGPARRRPFVSGSHPGPARLSWPFMMHRALWVVGAGLLLSLGACAERYNIRPTQLSELNDEVATNIGTRLTIKLETVDGRIVEVSSPVTVYD
jgi:hypothetical protein